MNCCRKSKDVIYIVVANWQILDFWLILIKYQNIKTSDASLYNL